MARRRRKDLIFVGIQLLLFVGYLVVPALANMVVNQITQVVGLALLVIGTGIFLAGLFQLRRSLTPFPSVRPDGHLVTNGINTLSGIHFTQVLSLVCLVMDYTAAM